MIETIILLISIGHSDELLITLLSPTVWLDQETADRRWTNSVSDLSYYPPRKQRYGTALAALNQTDIYPQLVQVLDGPKSAVPMANHLLTAGAVVLGSIIGASFSYFATIRQLKANNRRRFAEAHLERKLDILAELVEEFNSCRAIVGGFGHQRGVMEEKDQLTEEEINEMDIAVRRFAQASQKASVYLGDLESGTLKLAGILFQLRIHYEILDESDPSTNQSLKSLLKSSDSPYGPDATFTITVGNDQLNVEYSDEKYREAMKSVESLLEEQIARPIEYFEAP